MNVPDCVMGCLQSYRGDTKLEFEFEVRVVSDLSIQLIRVKSCIKKSQKLLNVKGRYSMAHARKLPLIQCVFILGWENKEKKTENIQALLN